MPASRARAEHLDDLVVKRDQSDGIPLSGHQIRKRASEIRAVFQLGHRA
jgi:hypothetical protein